jgi:hypothetical protein
MNGAMRAREGPRRRWRTAGARILPSLALLALSACTTWRPVASFDGWSLYAESGHAVDPPKFEAAVAPAFVAVREALGPFRRTVSVHAWNGSAGAETSGAEVIHEGEGGPVQEVPGIGPARVRAYHARGDGWFGPPAGIFLAAPECGTVAHELVHARAAEDGLDLPLWLEEGVACILGDGFQDGKRWIVDGLSCWPLRELQSQKISSDDLAHLLALHASDSSSARENVLAHFVGWAIVFDLYREEGRIDWLGWRERYAKGIPLAEASLRLARVIDPDCALDWMKRLRDPKREVRMATAKGVWKLRSTPVTTKLLDAIEDETDPEVKVCLAINLLACAGEARLPDLLTGRLWRVVWPALRHTSLADPAEQQGVEELMRSFRRWGGGRSQEPLQALRRFWAE